jgi:hypothetical protein
MEQLDAGHQGVDRSILEGNTNASAYLVGMCGDIKSGNDCSTRGRSQQGGQHAYCGALARAVWSEESKNLTVVDNEVYPIDGLYVTEVASQAFGEYWR